MSGDTVEQIKSRLNIMDVVESYVKLQKAGKNYKALSPFSSEKTPSFFVSPDQGLYYCFSSGKGGDMFTFIQEIEGVDFAGALKILAKQAGVELTQQDPKLRNEKEKILAALEASTRYYENILRKQPKVIEYLKRRGITGISAKKFRIGYAIEDWRGLHDHLSSQGFDPSIMEKAGLVIRSAKGYYDRFRGRVIFPIFNDSGAVVAFSGRIFHTSGAQEDKAAKYVNSPETVLYNKSEILYGFDKAKQTIREKNFCVFVEGQMDLVLAHQVDTCNTVAVSGTALSRRHLTLVRRFTEDLIFAFDADAAGMSAVKRGIDIALEEGFEVRVANVPQGKDPADLINDDPEKWKKIISDAQHVIDFYLDALYEQENDDRSKIRSIEETVLPYVARLKSNIDQAHFVSKIANTLQIAEKPIWEELGKIKSKPSDTSSQDAADKSSPNDRKAMSRRDNIKEKILGIFLWQSGVEKSDIDLDGMKERYKEITKDGNFLIKDIPLETKGRLVFETENYCGNRRFVQKQIDDLLLNLEKEILKERSVELHRKLKQAEMVDDKGKEDDILIQIQEVKRKIDELGSDST